MRVGENRGGHKWVCASGVGYDADGNTVTTRLPASYGGDDNATETSTFTTDDLLATVTGPDPSHDGSQTTVASYSYDADGRQLTTTDANNLTSCAAYNPDGSVAEKLTDAGADCSDTSHEEDFSYNADGKHTVDQLIGVTVDGAANTDLKRPRFSAALIWGRPRFRTAGAEYVLAPLKGHNRRRRVWLLVRTR